MIAAFKPTPHKEAAAAILKKPLLSRSVFDQLLPELRGRAFAIAGVASADVAQRVRDELATVPQGTNWDDAKAGVMDALEPYLGDGAEKRAELLLRTHTFQAAQAATWRYGQEDPETVAWQYLTMDDGNVRDSHRALNGIIAPKDDPFWRRHFPPWEWGCRCSVAPVSQDYLEEQQALDERRNPENRLVAEGPVLRRMNEGFIERDGKTHVIAPAENTNRPNAYAWNPADLKIPLETLREKYADDRETWNDFEQMARTTRLDGQDSPTLWEWLQS